MIELIDDLQDLRSKIHAGRFLLLQFFYLHLKDAFSVSTTNLRVAVVGGSANDPELRVIESLFGKCNVTTLGIERSDVFLDLNSPLPVTEEISKDNGFDLVICSQVIEHTWNLEAVFRNLLALVGEGGFLWINYPYSNLKHLSPDYFFSGLTSEVAKNYLTSMGALVIAHGDFGSERLYRMTHHHMYWPTHRQLVNPFLRGFAGWRIGSILRFAKYFMKSTQAIMWSNKVQRSSRFSTESFLFVQSPVGWEQ